MPCLRARHLTGRWACRSSSSRFHEAVRRARGSHRSQGQHRQALLRWLGAGARPHAPAAVGSASALAPGVPSEASQEVAPTLPARHPRLLVCRAKSRLRQANSATSARFGAGIRLVDLCQGFFFLELGCTSVPDIPRTEQSFSQFFFHNCVWWLIVRRMPSSAGETIHRAARQLQLRSLSRAPCEGKASPVAPGCCLEVEADRVCGLVGSPARHVPNVSRSPVRRTIAMPTIAAVSS